jgi:hypothetical protein
MSLTLSEIQAITDDIWLPNVQDNWSKGNVLMFKLLGKVEKVGSGEKFRAPLEHARARGGAFGASSLFNTAKKEVINAARFDWSYFYTNLTYDIDDEVQISGGDAEVDALLTKLNNAQNSLRDYMGDALWMSYSDAQTEYGGETKPWYGIPDLMNQTGTTAYGGIQPDDLTDDDGNSIWLAYVDSSALTMSFETMQSLRRGCSVNNNADGKPDLYVTTTALKDAFENSLQAQQRFADEDMVKAGFDNIKFGSRGVVVDDDKCTSGYVNAFNMAFVKFRAHRDKFFAGPVWKEPTNQPLKTSQIIFAGGFYTNQRRAHGQLQSVS